MWLSTTNISGTLSDSIGNLESIVDLGLYGTNITGTIPFSVGSLQKLELLYLYSTRVYGHIPDSLYNCTKLTQLLLNNNELTGSISPLIGQLNLTYFTNFYNHMTGSIPSGICSPTLLTLTMFSNHHNGTIPECLFQMQGLESLNLGLNNLTGSIPNNIQKSQMVGLSLYGNQLTGTIPASISQLTELFTLYLSINNLNGSIPEEIYSIPNMMYIDFFQNDLTGTISNFIGNWTLLEYFYGYQNNLVGTIPEAICAASGLGSLGLNLNHFSGRFPECIWSFPSIYIVSIGDNMLTGTIPSNLGETQLSEMLIFSNQFSGSLPNVVPESLIYIVTDNNAMTGTIPYTLLDSSPYISLVTLDGNYFTGTIPSSVSLLAYTTDLNLQYNILSGTLPDLTQLAMLNYISVSNNVLSGSLDGVFYSTAESNINNIDLSSNQFTGTLPSYVFNIPELFTFAAVSNCFTGTISADWCKATLLTALALDGLHTASSCRNSLLPRISDSYGLNYYWSGGIPECLFNMSYISTLHVSGNGIGGSLPANLTLGPYLTDLALSYNQLTGHIPESIGNRAFDNVDLSFNRFSGILSASSYQAEDSTVSYQVNRLSGNIPAVLRDVDSISILNGNHFLCRFDREQLPKHDKQHSYYECGTSSLERSIYAWVVLFGVTLLVSAYMLYITRSNSFSYIHQTAQTTVGNITNWLNIFSNHESNPMNVQLLGVFMRDLRRCTALLTMFVVLVLIPTNVALSQYYDTYQYPYAWSVASVYLSGYTAAVVLSILFTVLMVWMSVVFYALLTSNNENTVTAEMFEDRSIIIQSFKIRMVLSLIVIALFNFAVVLSVNIGYVLVATRYNPTIVSMTQIAVSVYKLVWNDLIIRNLVSWCHQYWSVKCGVSMMEGNEWSGSYLIFNTYTLIFNVIVIPCLATAAVSSDCFYDVLVPPSNVDSYYIYYTCGLIVNSVCVSSVSTLSDTSYLPPYIYRYQCSSTLVATYAILYVYNFIILSFFQPLLVVTLMWWRRQLDEEGMLYRVLVSVGVFVTDIGRLFDKDRFNLRMIMYLSIFVTFGVIFPPLAVMILLTVVVQTYFTQLLLGHFVNSIESESTRQSSLQVLDVSCKSASVLFKQTVYVVCPCAAFFYAYTVYDTYADAGGGSGAVWMSCSLFAAGCIISAVFKLAVMQKNSADLNGRSSVVEITDFKARSPIHTL